MDGRNGFLLSPVNQGHTANQGPFVKQNEAVSLIGSLFLMLSSSSL